MSQTLAYISLKIQKLQISKILHFISGYNFFVLFFFKKNLGIIKHKSLTPTCICMSHTKTTQYQQLTIYPKGEI